jgi:very-long-chain (3R)-3-hydroxyacyl-CoA dehydratase
VRHLLALNPAPVAKSSASAAASSIVQTVLSHLPSTLRKAAPLSEQAKAKVWVSIPAFLIPYVQRAKTFYAVAGPEVAFVQSFAILEVVHVILGLVPSPLVTTAMQVASRLWIIWGVVEQFPEVSTLS